jgi:hypothetical protein
MSGHTPWRLIKHKNDGHLTRMKRRLDLWRYKRKQAERRTK